MKKLMIAATIVCVAAFAQAADFNWTIAGIVNTTDTGYLGDGNIGRVFNASDIARDTLVSQLAVGNFANWELFGYQENAVAGGMGEIAALPTYASKDAGTYDWYAVILDASTTAGAKSYATTTMEKEILDGAGNETLINFGDQFDIMYGNDKWTAVQSVPEPTSGLLLLLGMAGLALRRRRA